MTQQRYCTACAAIKLVQDEGLLDMTNEDFAFLTGFSPWVATDRARVRRVVEAAIYGTLDYLGMPRFAVSAEYVAAAISYYVHPVNIKTACMVMEGAEFTENIIQGVERPLRASEIFAHVLQVNAGNETNVEREFSNVQKKLKA